MNVLFIYCMTFLFVACQGLQAAEIKSIKWLENDDLTVVLNSESKVTHFNLTKPHRLVLDFKNAQLKTRLPSSSKSKVITKIRGGQRDKGYRLVIESKQALSVSLKNKKVSSSKYTVNIGINSKGSKSSSKKGAKTSANKGSTKSNTLRNVNHLKNKKRDVLIVLDAGHGGKDPGAISVNGVKEKYVVQSIVKHLEKMLDNEPGFYTKNIRRKDVYLNLRDRREKARDKNADLFVSIHADAFPQPSVRGASVYVLSNKGASSATAKFLAQSESLSNAEGGVDLSSRDAMLRGVLVDIAMNDKMSSSVGVANSIVSGLSPRVKMHSKRVENAAFAVLKMPDVPAVLVETGFISNPEEARLLSDPAYQKKVAYGIFLGIKAYYYKNPPEGSYIAWKKRNKK